MCAHLHRENGEACRPRVYLSLVAVFCIAATLATGTLFAGSTKPGQLFMPQGGAAPTANGDYIMATGGLNTPYRMFVEVPQGLSRLRVQINDADVGAGGLGEAAANRDRQRTAPWDTTATYSLFNPSGRWSRP